MAPNDGEQKEILTRIAMPTRLYFRCLILTGAAMGLFLFATSFPAGAQWVNYPTAGERSPNALAEWEVRIGHFRVFLPKRVLDSVDPKIGRASCRESV